MWVEVEVSENAKETIGYTSPITKERFEADVQRLFFRICISNDITVADYSDGYCKIAYLKWDFEKQHKLIAVSKNDVIPFKSYHLKYKRDFEIHSSTIHRLFKYDYSRKQICPFLRDDHDHDQDDDDDDDNDINHKQLQCSIYQNLKLHQKCDKNSLEHMQYYDHSELQPFDPCSQGSTCPFFLRLVSKNGDNDRDSEIESKAESKDDTSSSNSSNNNYSSQRALIDECHCQVYSHPSRKNCQEFQGIPKGFCPFEFLDSDLLNNDIDHEGIIAQLEINQIKAGIINSENSVNLSNMTNHGTIGDTMDRKQSQDDHDHDASSDANSNNVNMNNLDVPYAIVRSPSSTHSGITGVSRSSHLPPLPDQNEKYGVSGVIDQEKLFDLLVKEVKQNGKELDLRVCWKVEFNGVNVHDILKEKMLHARHRHMGYPLTKAEMLSLLLYCNGDSSYDLCSSQRKKNYKKWVVFDYCLNVAIEKLKSFQTHKQCLYSGIGDVMFDFLGSIKKHTKQQQQQQQQYLQQNHLDSNNTLISSNNESVVYLSSINYENEAAVAMSSVSHPNVSEHKIETIDNNSNKKKHANKNGSLENHELTFPTFTSFTTDIEVAKSFRGKRGMIIGLRSKDIVACDVSWISHFSDEKEVLVTRFGNHGTIDRPKLFCQSQYLQYIILTGRFSEEDNLHQKEKENNIFQAKDLPFNWD